MDKAGDGQEIVAADLAQNRDPSFIGFTHQMFLEVRLRARTAPVAMTPHNDDLQLLALFSCVLCFLWITQPLILLCTVAIVPCR